MRPKSLRIVRNCALFALAAAFALAPSANAVELLAKRSVLGRLEQVIRAQYCPPPDKCRPDSSGSESRPQLPSSESPSPQAEPQQEQIDRASPAPEQFAGTGSTSMTVNDSAQSAAPYMMGDLLTVGTSTIVIPVLTGPGTPFVENVNVTSPPISGSATTPVHPMIPPGFPANAPIQFLSPNNPPFFPPRTFNSSLGSADANNAFRAGNPNIALTVQPQFNQDSQAYLISQHPAGSTLPTGQTASGGGTAQLLQAVASLVTSGPPPVGQNISTNDLFNLNSSYLYTPNVFFNQQPVVIIVPNPGDSGGAVLGINKIAENTSPLPRDRIFFNYSLFGGTNLAPGGVTVNRFVPGFEKTFFDKRTSIEMRFPFAATLNPDLVYANNGFTSGNGTVFGNMSVVFKGLVRRTNTFAMSVGLQTVVPTAPSLSLSLPDGLKIVDIPNQAVHAMPFIGAIYTPNDQFFAQGFVQADIDVNGNPVFVNPDLQGLTQVGHLHAANFVYFDLNAGYWLQRSRGGALTGFAPTIEFHYNQSVEANPYLQSNGFMIGSNLGQVSNQSVTIGCYLEYEQDTTLALGYTAPMGNGADQAFNGELRAFVTRRYGAPSRAARVGLF